MASGVHFRELGRWKHASTRHPRAIGDNIGAHPVTYDDAVDMAVQEAPALVGQGNPSGTAEPPSPRPSFSAIQSARRVWSAVSVPFWICVSRIGLGLVFAHLVVVLLPQAHQHLGEGTLSGGTWLGAFDRWDSAYYVGIAQHGYSLTHPSQTAFFPGYPMLITVVHALTFGTLGYVASAMVVSWAAFIGASVLLYRLGERLFSQRVALIATVLFCWFPASLFFISPYSEALFAFEIILFLTYLERHRYLAAAAVAACASATSPESVALTVTLLVAMALARQGVVRIVAYVALSGLGVGAYALFLWARFGHPFDFISVQQFWKRVETFPFVGLYRNVNALQHFFVGPGQPPGALLPTYANIKWVWILDDTALVVAAAATLALIAMAVTRRRTRAEGTLLVASETAAIPLPLVMVAAGIVLLAACTTISPYGLPVYASSEAEARFVSIAMPLYLAVALLIRRRTALICLAVGGCVMFALVFQALYNLGYWVT
jgi:hypothetical protein